jgi:hypothetical protein
VDLPSEIKEGEVNGDERSIEVPGEEDLEDGAKDVAGDE